MPRCWATCRASYTSSSEQHRPVAASGRDLGQPALIPKLHGQPDHPLARAMQHARDHGAIHSARHRDGDRLLRHTPAPAFSDARRTRRRRQSTRPPARSVFDRPSENRRLDLRLILASVRSPVSTCEGSVAPLEHADPLDTAKPFRSSAISSASLSMPSKRNVVVLGVRGAPAPLTCESRNARREFPAPDDRAAPLRAPTPPLHDPESIAPRGPAPPRPERSPYPRAVRARDARRTTSARDSRPLRTYSAPIPLGA